MTSFLQKAASMPRGRVLALMSILMLAQLLALWMLCDQQVRKAEARHAQAQAERMAANAAQVGAQPWDAAAQQNAAPAVPVTLAFR